MCGERDNVASLEYREWSATLAQLVLTAYKVCAVCEVRPVRKERSVRLGSAVAMANRATLAAPAHEESKVQRAPRVWWVSKDWSDCRARPVAQAYRVRQESQVLDRQGHQAHRDREEMSEVLEIQVC